MPNSTCDREDDKIFLLIFLPFDFIFMIVGILGNIAVIIYNIYLNQDKTPSSWLVTNLAFADLLVCLTLYPTKIAWFFLHGDDKGHAKQALGMIYFAAGISVVLSSMFLLSITVDRYVFIAKPLKYPLIIASRRIKAVLRCVWLVSFLILAVVFFFIATKQDDELHKNELHEKPFALFHIFPLPIPIAIIAFLNYKMLRIVREQRQRMTSETGLKSKLGKWGETQQAGPTQGNDERERPEHEREEKANSEQAHTEQSNEQYIAWLHHIVKELKAVKTFAIIFAILTCCFVPYIIIMTLESFCQYSCLLDERFKVPKEIVLELVGINSIANAFVYALRHRRYKKAFKKLFSSFWARL